ncbi:hypothetical protein QC764_503100 [Podospora pseudoanserina]|uniref:Uncharacterized protein n=1 Tax=Podospora pseudoanserina TaxID=2609844 RepID=A0ABR0I3H9_9PEZI|nr:hypothetical protein QC764_503100 [Podospora pseudoanserina]
MSDLLPPRATPIPSTGSQLPPRAFRTPLCPALQQRRKISSKFIPIKGMVHGPPSKGWELQPGHDTSLGFDQETRAWLEELYQAWASNAPISTFSSIRDGLVDQCDHLDTRISTFCSVARIVSSHRSQANREPEWKELLALSHLADRNKREEATKKKRKRAYNENNRLRNLAFIVALWSPDVVFHYAWNCASQVQMNMLRASATSYPDFFNEFLPRLNAVLLQRHRQALLGGRLKTLNEAPLQPHRDFDLITLASTTVDGKMEDLWVASQDGRVAVDAQATVFLRDIRPGHYAAHLLRRDRFGVLAARGEACLPSSPRHQHTMPLRTSPAEVSTGDDDGPRDAQIAPAQDQLRDTQPSLDVSLNQLENFQEMSSAPSEAMPLFDSMWDWNSADLSYSIDMHDPMCWQSSALFLSPSAMNSFGQHQPLTITSEPTTPSFSSPSRIHSEPSPTSPQSSELEADLYTSAALYLGTAPITGKCLASLEETLHNQYYPTIMPYIDSMLAKEARQEPLETHQDQAPPLEAATKWASMWTQGNAVLPGRAASPMDADVLYLTSNEAIQAAKAHQVFEKPVIIKETFLDSGMHAMLDSLCLLKDELANSVHDRGTSNLRNMTHSHRPLLTMLPRFRLLDYLVERLRLRTSRSASACQQLGSPEVLPEIRTDFNAVTLPHVCFGPSFATMSGVWLRNLEGLKICIFASLSDTDTDPALKSLERSDTQRAFILEQDDILIIPPASRIVYTVYSPVQGIMEGGIFWDSLALSSLLDSTVWIQRRGPGVASKFDEAITFHSRQLLGLLEALRSLMDVHPHLFGDSIVPSLLESLDQALARSDHSREAQ